MEKIQTKCCAPKKRFCLIYLENFGNFIQDVPFLNSQISAAG